VSSSTEMTYVSVAGKGSSAAPLYHVPGSSGERDGMKAAVRDFVSRRSLIAPMSRMELEEHAADIASENGLDPRVREFLMILVHNEVWKDVVASVPFRRRTLLLPPCLRSRLKCPARFDEFGLMCERCGSCVLGTIGEEAEELGYAVLIAEGTTVVAGLIEQGMIDAVIGVSCMPSLERAFISVSSTVVPGIAIPLLEEGCSDTQADVEWIRECLRLTGPAVRAAPDMGALRREVASLFEPACLPALLRAGTATAETVAIEWLGRAGKRWRPVLAAGVYRALAEKADAPLPGHVRSVVLAVECIHKASLIYDDIQDRDDCRYGEPTVHMVHGIPVALTASLYLLGLGYRLLSECDIPAGVRAEMLTLATDGHCELCRGQGDELGWMRDPRPLSPDEVLDIFRRKTAPSFEVVFRLGAMCAGAGGDVHGMLTEYSSIVGVAYQILDDMDDFKSGGDVDDVKMGRPSIVMALAHQMAEGQVRERIAAAWTRSDRNIPFDEVRGLIAATGAEKAAAGLLDEHRRRAAEVLRNARSRPLKMLLHTVLAKVLKND